MKRNSAGFTFVGLLVILGTIAVLAFVLLAALSAATAMQRRVVCCWNLKHIGLAYCLFAENHQDRPSMSLPAEKDGSLEVVGKPLLTFRHFLVLSNYLDTPKLLICPADALRIRSTVFATNWEESPKDVPLRCNRNISYFVGTEADPDKPDCFFAGDRNLTNSRAPLVLSPHTDIAISTYTKFSTNPVTAGWTTKNIHRLGGNVVMGNGSVREMDTSQVQEALRNSGDTNNWLQIPGNETNIQ